MSVGSSRSQDVANALPADWPTRTLLPLKLPSLVSLPDSGPELQQLLQAALCTAAEALRALRTVDLTVPAKALQVDQRRVSYVL